MSPSIEPRRYGETWEGCARRLELQVEVLSAERDELREAAEYYRGELAREGSNAAAVLGRMGGSKGGKARAEKLTRQQLSEIGKLGAEARWKKR